MNLVEKCKQCIACPVAHQMICDYYDFYREYAEYNKNLAKEKVDLVELKKYATSQEIKNARKKYNAHKKLPEEIIDIVNTISERFKIIGTPEKQCDYLTYLVNKNLKAENIFNGLEKDSDTFDCLLTLNIILSNIKIYLDGIQENNADKTINGQIIIDTIKEFLSENNISIRQSKGTYTDEDYSRNYDIFKTYCYTVPEELKFKYSKPIYGYNLRSCDCENFLNVINSLDEKPILSKIGQLNDEHKNIMREFLIYAPKKTSYILEKLKDMQGLSYSEIGVLFFKDEYENKNESTVQNLITNPNRVYSDIEIKKLAKIFLVSEDVLRCGTGTLYGNWRHIKDTNVYDEIKRLVEDDDCGFENEIQKYFDIEIENICLYAEKLEPEDIYEDIYYDYLKMYRTATQPESIEVLLGSP